MGRAAYRMGTTVPGAIKHAEHTLGRTLDGTERVRVLEGWRDERTETALDAL